MSADASLFGLGAVLLQDSDGVNRPVAYASRPMKPTELRYSQIDRGFGDDVVDRALQ